MAKTKDGKGGVGNSAAVEEPVAIERYRGELAAESKEATDLLSLIETLNILTQDDYDMMGEVLIEVKKRHNVLEGKKRAATDPLNSSLNEIRSWFNPVQAYYLKCEAILKAKIAGYEEARAKANQEAVDAVGQAMADGGDEADVDAALAQVNVAEKPKGISTRMVWDFEIINADLLPRDYLVIDTTKIRKVMQLSAAHDGTPEPIPGVRFFQKTTVSARTR